MTTAVPFAEKRTHRRIPLEDVTVEICTPRGVSDLVDICPIMNLSRSGMLFECHHRYRLSQTLRLTFVLPESIIIFRTNARVAHTYSANMRTFVGVHFEKLCTAELRAIDHFIEQRCGE